MLRGPYVALRRAREDRRVDYSEASLWSVSSGQVARSSGQVARDCDLPRGAGASQVPVAYKPKDHSTDGFAVLNGTGRRYDDVERVNT